MTLPGLVPVPRRVAATGDAPFPVTPETVIAGDGDTARVFADLLAVRTGIRLAALGDDDRAQRRRSDAPDPADAASPVPTPRIGDIVHGSPASPAPAIEFRLDRAVGEGPESYAIGVDAASVTVTAPDPAGLFYGAHTLVQLLSPTPGAAGTWAIPAVDIADAPRFAYRGVMLDVARHFFPVETVRAYIDRAAALKFNHLHLHLTDDQGWRLQLHSRPALTEHASATAVGGDQGGFYTRADYAEIVAYAATRHMTVVPEIDVPGHTHAVSLAYPELTEAPVLSAHVLETVETFGGGIPTAGQPYEGLAVGFSSLRIGDEAVYDFLADVFGELAGMTPGPYLHIGGDECLGTPPDDFAEFIARVTEIVADLDKTPIAWHEAGAAPAIAPQTVGQYWGFVTPTDGMDDKARAFVRGGSRLILSPADAVYLDMQYPGLPGLGLAWANGPTSVQRAYAWEPSHVIAGVSDGDTLGVEAALWTETGRTADDLDTLAFPRIAAAAEVAWSPAPSAEPAASDPRTWESFRVRVGALGPLWTRLGIHFYASPEISWVHE